MTRKAAFLHSPDLDSEGYPPECPFNSTRAGKTRKTVLSMGLLGANGLDEVAPVPATREELELFHTPEYLDTIQRAEKGDLDAKGFAMGLGTPDCPVFRGMYGYVALACGATITGARLILAGETPIAFNPSGGFHHAAKDRASGFCYMNDIVIAAMILANAGKRVLFLDVDVHHCDGVEAAFYDRDDVMTISLHESGETLFPGTGKVTDTGIGKGKGFSVNLPLPVGTYDGAYRKAFTEAALPLVKAYDPDVIMLELGMDALSGDPLAHLHLTNNIYVDIIKSLLALEKPILATGGGGYHVENTVRGWALSWQTLCGEEDTHDGLALGGVMMENTDWAGGLRDRALISDAGQRPSIDQAVNDVISGVREQVFSIHGL